jgi:hypothetical protein
MAEPFFFFANRKPGEPGSYESLLTRRRIAEQLLGQQRPYPKTIGEGIDSLGRSFRDVMLLSDLDQRERAQTAYEQSKLAGLNPYAPDAAPPAAGVPPPVAGGGGGGGGGVVPPPAAGGPRVAVPEDAIPLPLAVPPTGKPTVEGGVDVYDPADISPVDALAIGRASGPRLDTRNNAALGRRVGFDYAVNNINPGLQAALIKAYHDMPEEYRSSFNLREGARTTPYQAFLHSIGAGKWPVAPPGYSRHEVGGAVDIAAGPAREWLRSRTGQYGIEPLAGDAPHFQLTRGGRTPTAEDARAAISRTLMREPAGPPAPGPGLPPEAGLPPAPPRVAAPPAAAPSPAPAAPTSATPLVGAGGEDTLAALPPPGGGPAAPLPPNPPTLTGIAPMPPGMLSPVPIAQQAPDGAPIPAGLPPGMLSPAPIAARPQPGFEEATPPTPPPAAATAALGAAGAVAGLPGGGGATSPVAPPAAPAPGIPSAGAQPPWLSNAVTQPRLPPAAAPAPAAVTPPVLGDAVPRPVDAIAAAPPGVGGAALPPATTTIERAPPPATTTIEKVPAGETVPGPRLGLTHIPEFRPEIPRPARERPTAQEVAAFNATIDPSMGERGKAQAAAFLKHYQDLREAKDKANLNEYEHQRGLRDAYNVKRDEIIRARPKEEQEAIVRLLEARALQTKDEFLREQLIDEARKRRLDIRESEQKVAAGVAPKTEKIGDLLFEWDDPTRTWVDKTPKIAPLDIKLNEQQQKMVKYLSQGHNASTALGDGAALAGFADTQKGRLPLVGNYWVSPEYRRQNTLAEVWAENFLREKSGALIGDVEFANEKRRLLPVPGDRPDDIVRKRALRAKVEESFLDALGPARPAGERLIKLRADRKTSEPTGTIGRNKDTGKREVVIDGYWEEMGG